MLQAALLNEVQEGRKERDEEGGVGREERGDMEEYPAGVEERKGCGFLAGAEGGDDSEEEANGQDEDAEGDGPVAPVDDEEGKGEEEAEEGLGLVGIDREGVVGGVEGFGEGDEVEEQRGDGGGDGDVAPAGAVVERGREDGERGNAVKENGDSEPKKRHKVQFARLFAANLQYIGFVIRGTEACGFRRFPSHCRGASFGVAARSIRW